MKHLKLIVDNTKKVKVFEVTINDDLLGLYSIEAYKELRLQMSTGDFHTHRALPVYVEDFSEVVTIDELMEVF